MIRTIKVNAEYKDFFSSTDYLDVDSVDISYIVTKVTEESIVKEIPGESIVSFEKIQVDNMLGVYKYLEYKLPEIEKEYDLALSENLADSVIREKRSRRDWFNKNIKFFKLLLSDIYFKKERTAFNKCTFITPKYAFFCKHFQKKQYKEEDSENIYGYVNNYEDKKIGRLYHNTSIQTLPREIRYHLFKNDYFDLDMVNAHPSIMYDVSEKYKLKLNGALKEYIHNRSYVLEIIKQEHHNKTNVSLETREVKKAILKGLNLENIDSEISSDTFKNLQLDFSVIRDHLYAMYTNGELNEYKVPLALKKIKNIKRRYPFNPKITLQSYYCQDQESVHTMRLILFLREKYLKHLENIEERYEFTDYFPNTDREVNLSAKHTLSTVPFFDGVYVSSPEHTCNSSLGSLIDEFNSMDFNSCVKFEQKEIEKNVSQITNEEELLKFIIIYKWVTRSSSKRQINFLIKHLDIVNLFINKLQEIDYKESEEKIKKEESNPERSEWETDYETLIVGLKSIIYKILLEQDIKSEHDIAEFISSLSETPL